MNELADIHFRKDRLVKFNISIVVVVCCHGLLARTVFANAAGSHYYTGNSKLSFLPPVKVSFAHL